jgi:hypothetical protein
VPEEAVDYLFRQDSAARHRLEDARHPARVELRADSTALSTERNSGPLAMPIRSSQTCTDAMVPLAILTISPWPSLSVSPEL